jgi:hypothetical protein
MFTVEVTAGQGLIPVVVNVRTAVPENPGRGAHVAVKLFAFGEKFPPAEELQIPPVAEPPIDPERLTKPP